MITATRLFSTCSATSGRSFVAQISTRADDVPRLRIWCVPPGPAGEGDNLARFQSPLIVDAQAERRRAREDEQQLFVCVMEVERGDHGVRLQLVEVRGEALAASMLSKTDGSEGRAFVADLGVPFRLKDGVEHSFRPFVRPGLAPGSPSTVHAPCEKALRSA